MKRSTLAALAFVLMTATAGAQDTIEGKALALDGDTILVTKADGTEVKIRLWAIDAPEMDVWPWGPRARVVLDALMAGKTVACATKGKSHDRIVARCFLDETDDLGKLLIAEGYAVEHRRFGEGIYKDTERDAAIKGVGIWNR